MTAALAPVPDSFAPSVAPPRRGPAGWWHDTRILTRRNVLHIRREPFQLSDVTIQPVMFCLLFVYVFGAATVIPGGTYADFVVAGILILNLTTGSVGWSAPIRSADNAIINSAYWTHRDSLAGSGCQPWLGRGTATTNREPHRASQPAQQRGRRAHGPAD